MRAGWVWGTFFMFKKSLLLQFPEKKLNDELFMYAEDLQWCIEITRLGKEIWFIPEPVIIHYKGASKADAERLIKVNEEYLMKKYYSLANRFILKISNYLKKI